MGDIDAAGGIVEGGLFARAIERRAGDAHDGGHGLCLNCGTTLSGAHCHRCGQAAHVHRSLGAIGHEILHGVVHFEGKLWRTLPLLAWRPGDLTRRYIAGERARFVSPMALFLFSVFTMFAVFSIVGIAPPADVAGQAQIRAGLERAVADHEADRARLAARRAGLPPGDGRRVEIDRRLVELDEEERALRGALPAVKDGGFTLFGGKTGWQRLDKGIEKANRNPGLMLYKLQANSYKFSWLLIPLSLPFMWLLFFWRRDIRLYDHAVFVTYSIAAMSLLFIALTLLSQAGVGNTPIAIAATLIPLAHIYRQLRGAYRLRRRSAMVRTMLLLVFTGVVLALFLMLLLGLGLVD